MNTGAINQRPITYRQLRAVDFWFRNGRKSKAQALREAGYGNSIVRQPHKVFDSPAVRKELERRGHGTTGVLNNQLLTVDVIKETPTLPTLDLSKITKEQIQLLRKRLDTIPDPQIKQVYQTITSGVSYTQKSTVRGNNLDPYSSM